MTCSFYYGTQAFHPSCGKGYSYYYNDCCNFKWYVAWNVIMWLFVAAFVVAIVLMSLGLLFLPPVTISMPLKILLFVLVDGWTLVVQSLAMSFRA